MHIQEDEEKKENKDVNNDELFRRSPKNLEQSDTESFNHGERYSTGEDVETILPC